MAKYIIELEDEPMVANSSHQEVDELWKAKGFNSLVFDKCGLDKLAPYTELDRSVIEDEVWEFAKELISMSENEVSDMMGCMTNFGEVMYNVPYQEAKAKYEAWKAEREQIRVGDEIVLNENEKMVVTRVTQVDHETFIQGVDENGECFECIEYNAVKKTDKHFPEVVELLKKIRGEEK